MPIVQHAYMRLRGVPLRFGSTDGEREWLEAADAVRRMLRPGSYSVAPMVHLQTRRGQLVGQHGVVVEVRPDDLADQLDDSGRVVTTKSEVFMRAVSRGEVLEGT
jgi:hypothetical protein